MRLLKHRSYILLRNIETLATTRENIVEEIIIKNEITNRKSALLALYLGVARLGLLVQRV